MHVLVHLEYARCAEWWVEVHAHKKMLQSKPEAEYDFIDHCDNTHS